MTNKLVSTTPACAACKYQRRRCTPNCPLAPYFPANNPKMFQNVHRLFGVSNITKALNNLKSTDQRDEAMRSIIYEADIRERFPVMGCCGVIMQLQVQLQNVINELEYVKARIVACREQQQLTSSSGNNNHNNEANYENGMNYGINQFLSNENGDFLVDNSVPGNLAAIEAQMAALMNGHEEMNLLPGDLERMQFSTRNIDERQPPIDHTRETFESRVENEADSAGATSSVTERKPWL